MKILILGTGSAQYDAIRYCRDAGCEVYACGAERVGPGVALVDRFEQIDIRDVDRVERYAGTNGVDLVYSVGSDLAMPTVGAVSRRLGLRHFVGPDVAAACQHKDRMRQALGPDFPGNVSFMAVPSADELADWDRFPCVLKPVDNQGQRGVFEASNREEMQRLFPGALAHSRRGAVIIEELVDGPEVSLNGYVVEGGLVFAQITDRLVFEEYPGGIVRGHRIPSTAAAGPQMIRDTAQTAVERLGIAAGPVYFQMKLTGSEPRVIEVTPRLDGCHLWRLIREHCGVDLLDATFRQLVSGAAPEFSPQPTVALELRFLCVPPGEKLNRQQLKPGTPRFLQWYYADGEEVRTINGRMEKAGYLIEAAR